MAAIPNQFEAPTAFSNVVLIVDGKKLHVNKDFLSVHSPVFAAMFNGDFVEKGKEEIEIKEVVYEEFVHLLSVIYPGCSPFTDSSVEYILKLADQFQMKDASVQAEKFLIETTVVTVEKKMIMADKFNNQKLMDHCLNSFKNNIHILESFPNYDNFSDDLKKIVWNKMNRMADSNTFVLRWDLRNVSTITDRKAESDVLEAGGFEWTAQMRPNHTVSNSVEFVLMCNHLSEEWCCEVDVNFYIHMLAFFEQRMLKFEGANNNVQVCSSAYPWHGLIAANGGFMADSSIEIKIKIVNSKCVEIVEPILDLEKFCSPNEACNVKLIIGGEKLEVSKDFLAMHSPVFAAMFYKNFAEKDKDEIEVKEVDYKEFVDLLQLIFPVQAKITGRTILHVLSLADRFQIKQVLITAEEYLLTTSKFITSEKLQLADEFRLAKLKKECLQSYTSVQQITALKSSLEYASFTNAIKAAICDRIMTLA